MKLNEAIKLIKEDIKPGMERLVSFVDTELNGKIPRKDIRNYIKDLKRDTAFITRIKEKAKEINNDGYIWSSIRYRTLEHFRKQLNNKK